MAVALTSQQIEKIRSDFPILTRVGRGGRPVAYLDSAATSQKPRVVVEAESDFYFRNNGAINRGTHLLGDEATSAFEDSRYRLAQFIGARPEEIVWTKNATEALNLLAGSLASPGELQVKATDNIVVTRAEHHSNLVPWQELSSKTGAELRWLDLTADGRIDLNTCDVIDENTKVVAFTHASNVTGAVSEVGSIVAAADAHGALKVLDTCQSSAHMKLDVEKLAVDFAVFSSHKMFGPTGIGALWGRQDLLEALPPFLTGGSVVADVSMEETIFLPPPNRFEAGSQPVAQAVGWARALDYMDEIGMENISAHEQTLLVPLLRGLEEIPGCNILGPRQTSNRLAVVAFEVEGVHPHDVGQFLDSKDLAVRVGHHCAIPLHRHFGVKSSSRASLSVFNTSDEIERLIEAVSEVRAYFRK